MRPSPPITSPTLRAILKPVAETSKRAPTGNDAKRGDDEPSSDDIGEGAEDNTGLKRGPFDDDD